MSEKKSKSKKLSGASYKTRPKTFTLFLDRNFGNIRLVRALREAGFHAEIHDDHLRPDAPDEEWIEFVAKNDWLALTQDKNIKNRHAEILAVRKFKTRVLVVRAKNTTAEDIAEILIKSHSRIQKFANATKPPFIAGIVRSGTITDYEI